MSYTAIPEDTSQTHSEKRSAALFSVLAALGITLLKFLTGQLFDILLKQMKSLYPRSCP